MSDLQEALNHWAAFKKGDVYITMGERNRITNLFADAARAHLSCPPHQHSPSVGTDLTSKETVEKVAKTMYDCDDFHPDWDKIESDYDKKLADEYRETARAVLRAVKGDTSNMRVGHQPKGLGGAVVTAFEDTE